jgi:hypothetical protein
VNAHFRGAFADWFAVAKIAIFSPINSGLNTPDRLFVAKRYESRVKNLSGEDGVHG